MYQKIKDHLNTHARWYIALSAVALLAVGGLIAAFAPSVVASLAASLPASVANLAYAATAIVVLAPAMAVATIYGLARATLAIGSYISSFFAKGEPTPPAGDSAAVAGNVSATTGAAHAATPGTASATVQPAPDANAAIYHSTPTNTPAKEAQPVIPTNDVTHGSAAIPG